MEGVDTEYKPEKGTRNKHAAKNWLWLAILTLMCGGMAAYCLWMYPKFTPDDPDLMMRWLLEAVIRLFTAFFAAELYLVYRDWRVNGNLFKGIIASPLSCGIFGGLVFLGTVLLCIGR